MKQQDLALISPDDLSLVESNSLNGQQLKLILQKTPDKYVHKRPAKGGGEWEYVTGGYVKKCLNLMFGWDWDFEIIDEKIIDGEAIVKGRLTCRSNGKVIVKMQYGNKDIVCKKGSTTPLSIGNDLKSAATDALKKCAAEIGIAADIYNKLDFKEVRVDTSKVTSEDVKELFEMKKDALSESDRTDIERILANGEEASYKKVVNKLKAL
jgi:recombination DNA repair RAD52 pathway protein